MNSLKEIISLYADFDPLTASYQERKPIGPSERQKIETQLTAFFSQFMVKNGVEHSKIDSQYKALRLLFHSDKIHPNTSETYWLEHVMSEGSMRGVCFKLVQTCMNKLKNPVPAANYRNIRDMDELLTKLKRQERRATTFTQKAMINSTIQMISSVKSHHRTIEQGERGWLQTSISTMPYITSGFCLGLYIEELALLFALTYALSKGGQWLEKSSSAQWEYVGHEMRSFSDMLYNASAALITYFIRLNFLAIDGIYYLGTQTCSHLYQAILPPPEPNDCTTLALPHQHLLGGDFYQTFELKILALSLERYREQQQAQWFASIRHGAFKSSKIQCALNELKKIDEAELEPEEKLLLAKPILEELSKNPRLNVKGSHAAAAIESMSFLYNFLVPATEVENEEDKLPDVFSITYID